ncbi:UDP-glucose 4-epimerase GEPI48-like [Iris pallida]|uniref:UDP-glucose 4-epimerase GEPI48-like n=1 Tax=Iris pallida TaxID=29817 RepID=A0AAX6GYY5_IRIPA|nr:UDP-glucose 4-epimerase GEPI48-like [Iris pallida]
MPFVQQEAGRFEVTREDVAKGFLASHTICHGREVQDDEKIVYVSEVIKPEARFMMVHKMESLCFVN